MKNSDKESISKTEGSREEKPVRRKALKSALVGGAVVSSAALPTKWIRPVANSVLLPAHGVTSAVDPDTGTTDPVEPPPPPPPPVNRNFFGNGTIIVKNMGPSTNDVQIAGVREERGLLEALTNGITEIVVPKANAGEPLNLTFNLCVADNDGSLDVTFQEISPFGQGSVINFVGSGGFDSPISLTSSCEGVPENFDATFTDTNDGMIAYSITSDILDGGSLNGSLSEGACALEGELCPRPEKTIPQ